MAKKVLSLQVDEKLKNKIDKFAIESGVSFSQFVRDLIDFDPYFLHLILGYSKRHNLPPYLVIQNMLIKRFAFEAAEDDFYGEPQPRELMEFCHTAEGFLTGEALFDWLKDIEYNRLGQEQLEARRTAEKKISKKRG